MGDVEFGGRSVIAPRTQWLVIQPNRRINANLLKDDPHTLMRREPCRPIEVAAKGRAAAGIATWTIVAG